MPIEDLAQAVEFFHADLVAISVSLATQLPTMQEAIAAIRAGGRGGIWSTCRGMKGNGETALSLGADGFAANVMEALTRGRELVGLGPKSR